MDYLFGVSFPNQNKYQYFLSNYEINIGEEVVCVTPRGLEIGKIVTNGKEYYIDENTEIPFPYIERIVTEEDLLIKHKNEEDSLLIMKEVQGESDNLNLNMKIISAEYTLDRTKLMISYLSESRVDFRDLLKILASLYHCRIELRQIGSRDKAKMIGGLGVCGLKLCCNTFLNEFDGISITMAKNQMLTLNIPKLSGQCGKLMCCLKFENDDYSEAKKPFPKVGVRVNIDDNIYKLTSYNVLTKICRLESNENIINLPLSEIENKIVVNFQTSNNNQRDNENAEEETSNNIDLNKNNKNQHRGKFNHHVKK